MNDQCRLEAVFRKAFSSADLAILCAQNGEGNWDSLRHMVLINLIEEEFNILIEIWDIAKVTDFASALALVTAMQGLSDLSPGNWSNAHDDKEDQ
jgi:hypothetical protein